eukprot:5550203-Prymnesium_polylepis.1
MPQAGFQAPGSPRSARVGQRTSHDRSKRKPQRNAASRDALHVDQEHDPTLMLERALNGGARSCNHSSKPRAIVHRVISGIIKVKAVQV